MSSDLRCHFTRKQLMAGIIAAQNRYCGLIARSFESEDCHKRTVGQARRLPNSATGGCPTIRARTQRYFFTACAFGALCCA
jgi:hypothetical protein